MISEEKQKALEAALGNIEKQFGKGSVMKLGDSSSHMQVEAVPIIGSSRTGFASAQPFL